MHTETNIKRETLTNDWLIGGFGFSEREKENVKENEKKMRQKQGREEREIENKRNFFF